MKTWDALTPKQRSSYSPCPSCGGPKSNHAYMCRSCSPLIPRGEKHYAWKGDAARGETKRSRVANARLVGPCELCGDPGKDRHHVDGDPGNNAATNIMLLCRRCHMIEDGRMKNLVGRNQDLSPCRHCGRPHKTSLGFSHGMCNACRSYYIRNGINRPLEWLNDQFRLVIPAKPPSPCIICYQDYKPLRRGRCHSCNEYFRRNGKDRGD